MIGNVEREPVGQIDAAENGSSYPKSQTVKLIPFNQRHFARAEAEFGITICRPAAALAAIDVES